MTFFMWRIKGHNYEYVYLLPCVCGWGRGAIELQKKIRKFESLEFIYSSKYTCIATTYMKTFLCLYIILDIKHWMFFFLQTNTDQNGMATYYLHI